MNDSSNQPKGLSHGPSEPCPLATKVYIHERSLLARLGAWKLHEDRVALTIGRHIFLSRVSKVDFLRDAAWVAHELAHVRQFKKYGLVRFMGLYIGETFKKGYYLNQWEIEARRQSIDLSILDHYYFV